MTYVLDESTQVHMVYIDFHKAFDKIVHSGVHRKLSQGLRII